MTATASPTAKNIQAVACVLVVSDIHRSAAFYQEKLGFRVEQIWGDPPGFAIADAPGGAIMLKQSVSEADAGTTRPNHKEVGDLWDAYIWVKNLEPVLADLKNRGTEVTEPFETVYGCTEMTVNDPDGYIICFGYCP